MRCLRMKDLDSDGSLLVIEDEYFVLITELGNQHLLVKLLF